MRKPIEYIWHCLRFSANYDCRLLIENLKSRPMLWTPFALLFFAFLTIISASAWASEEALHDVSQPRIRRFWVQIDHVLHSCEFDGTYQCVIPGLGRGAYRVESGIATWTSEGTKSNRIYNLNIRESASSHVIGGLGVEGEILWQGKDRPGVISNGFQSWSYSGLIELPGPISLHDLVGGFNPRNEEFRDGLKQSWEFSVLLSKDQFVTIGALSASQWRPWVRFELPFKGERNNAIGFKMISGMTGDMLPLGPGQTVESESWSLALGQTQDLPRVLQNYEKMIDLQQAKISQENFGSPSVFKYFGGEHSGDVSSKVHFGWNSWYHLWNNVSSQAVHENLDRVALLLPRMLGIQTPVALYATIDDGWQDRWGEWQPNRKFPGSLAQMAEEISAKGFVPGLWLAPLLVSTSSPLIKDHPHWFVKTPDFDHPSGHYKILDSTHPEVAQHLTQLFQSIKNAGFKFVKLDFLFAGTFSGQRHLPVTAMSAYQRAMQLFRQVLGSSVEILACGAPHLASRPYIDRWRIGPDIAYEYPTGSPTWIDIAIQARNIGTRWFLCHGLACDSDPWLLRGKRPLAEIGSSLWVAALTGSGVTLSDDFNRVSLARQRYQPPREAVNQAASGLPAVPDYGAWLERADQRLKGAELIDRLFSLKQIGAPAQWDLGTLGSLYLNFGEFTTRVDQYDVVRHGSLWLAPKDHEANVVF